MNNLRSYKNVVDIERSHKNRGTYRGVRVSETIPNDDGEGGERDVGNGSQITCPQ